MHLFRETGWRWWWLVLLVLVADQLSKVWVIQNFSLGESVSLLPVFNFTYARNYGAAFSFLGDAGGWQRWFFHLDRSGGQYRISHLVKPFSEKSAEIIFSFEPDYQWCYW